MCCSKAVHSLMDVFLRTSSTVAVHGFKCVDGVLLPFCNCAEAGFRFSEVNLLASKAGVLLPSFWEHYNERRSRCIHQRCMLAVWTEFFGDSVRRYPQLAPRVPEYEMHAGFTGNILFCEI